MALTTPDTAAEVADRIVQDVESALQPVGGKPSLKNSWLNGLIVAFANRFFDFYFALNQAALEAIPDTAVSLLDRWAAIWGRTRTPGTPSGGNVIASGTLGSTIPVNSVLTTGDGKTYKTAGIAEITAKALAVPATQLTSDGAGTATCDLSPTKHVLGSQILISVTGAAQSEYNVANVVATITSDKVFTYPITGVPASPATGSPVVAFESGTMVVESLDFGEDEDQPFDAALQFENPIVGIDDVARVDFDAVGGGADQELDEDLRERLLDRIQNPVAQFNVAAIEAAAKAVAGVTRVFVQEITPAVGQATIYFMRDNDANPIPSGAEVADVDAVIQAIRPATSDSADVIVLAPTAVPTDFTFTDIQPNTGTMKAAIEANLAQFFAENTSIGIDVDEDGYRSAIFNTVDTVTGDVVTTFTLSAPSGDITIAAGEIGTLGNVTF